MADETCRCGADLNGFIFQADMQGRLMCLDCYKIDRARMLKHAVLKVSGTERIAWERAHQIGAEGWTAEHDDRLTSGALAVAAACYAAPQKVFFKNPLNVYHDPWPFDVEWDKRRSIHEEVSVSVRIHELEKAGALVAAEIDRLLRIEIRVLNAEETP